MISLISYFSCKNNITSEQCQLMFISEKRASVSAASDVMAITHTVHSHSCKRIISQDDNAKCCRSWSSLLGPSWKAITVWSFREAILNILISMNTSYQTHLLSNRTNVFSVGKKQEFFLLAWFRIPLQMLTCLVW